MNNAMPTFFGEETEDTRARGATGRLLGEETLRVRFFKKPVLSTEKSTKENRPVYDEIDHIEIVSQGDRQSVNVMRVKHTHIDRFPQEWAHYQSTGQTKQDVGIPLEEWPALSEALRKEFKYFNITTVEGIAAMSDATAQKFTSQGLQYREKAKQFLQVMKDDALVSKQAAEMAELRKEIEALKAAKTK